MDLQWRALTRADATAMAELNAAVHAAHPDHPRRGHGQSQRRTPRLPARGLHGHPQWNHIGADQISVLTAAADRVGQEWSESREVLPRQVIHGDLGGSNALADLDTGQVTALLDFEFVGSGRRVQDFLVAMYNSPVLNVRDWQLRVAAFTRGYAAVCRLEPAEVAALPGLLRARSFGSAVYRAGQWRAGKARLDEVTDRIRRLQATTDWLAAEGDTFQELVAAANRPGAVLGGAPLPSLPIRSFSR